MQKSHMWIAITGVVSLPTELFVHGFAKSTEIQRILKVWGAEAKADRVANMPQLIETGGAVGKSPSSKSNALGLQRKSAQMDWK